MSVQEVHSLMSPCFSATRDRTAILLEHQILVVCAD
jgi:hypothetical protein